MLNIIGANINSNSVLSGGSIAPTFYTPLASSLTQPYVFESNISDNVATVTDFEGKVHTCKANESRFSGVRRVENHVPAGDIPVLTGTDLGYVTAPDGTNTAKKVEQASTFIIALWHPVTTVGRTCVNSIWLRSDTVSTFKLYNGNSLNFQGIVTLSSTWTRYATEATTISTSGGIGFSASSLSGTDSIEYWHPQCEYVEGQTIQEPSEYVGVGVGTEILSDPEFDTPVSAGGSNDDFDFTGFTSSIAGGQLVLPAFQNAAGARTLTVGKLYLVEYVLRDYPLFGAASSFGGNSLASYNTIDTPYSIVFRAATSTYQVTPGFSGTTLVDYFRIKEIEHGSNVDGVKYFDYHNTLAKLDNEVYGTGRSIELLNDPNLSISDSTEQGTTNPDWTWINNLVSISNNILSFNSSLTVAATTPLCTVGKLYEITYTLTLDGDDLDTFTLGQVNLTKSAGTRTEIVKATSTGGILLLSSIGAGNSGTLSNLSVKEITSTDMLGTKFGRRVENLINLQSDAGSEDISNWNLSGANLSGGGLATINGEEKPYTTITFGASSSDKISSKNCVFDVVGKNLIGSIWVRSDSEKSFRLQVYAGSISYSADMSSTTEWQRFVVTRIPTAGTYANIGVINESAGGAGTINIACGQLEIGERVSEYVSTQADIYPYSGTGLDGVSEFPKTNQNIVVDNVVSTSYTPTSITNSTTTATVNATAHTHYVDQWISVSGAEQSAYNGMFQVASIAANSFTYEMSSDPGADASGTLNISIPGFSVTPGSGVLIEMERNNKAIQSTFSDNWLNYKVQLITNDAISPDGKSTACRIERADADSSLDYHYTYPNTYSIINANEKATFSVYAKAGECTRLGIDMYHATAPYIGAVFDLPTCTVVDTSNANAGIELVGNGWYRCWITNTVTHTSNMGFDILIGHSDLKATPPDALQSNISFEEGMWIWGAQLENIAATDIVFPCSYIPTTTTAVTRLPDLLDFDSTNYTETGAFYCEFKISEGLVVTPIVNGIIGFTDTDTINYFIDLRVFSTGGARFRSKGSIVGAPTDSDAISSDIHKIAATWNRGNATNGTLRWALDGVLIHDQSNYLLSSFPTTEVDKFTVGRRSNSSGDTNSMGIINVKNIKKWNNLLTAKELETITK